MTTLCGFIVRYGDRARLAVDHYERFARGSIVNGKVPIRVAHDDRPGATIAWATVSENDHGIRFEADLLDDPPGRALAHLVLSGCDGVSAAFRPLATRQSSVVEVVERARVTELSIVADPMYDESRCWIAGQAPAHLRPLVDDYLEPPCARSGASAGVERAASVAKPTTAPAREQPAGLVSASLSRARPAAPTDPLRLAILNSWANIWRGGWSYELARGFRSRVQGLERSRCVARRLQLAQTMSVDELYTMGGVYISTAMPTETAGAVKVCRK